MDVKKLAMEKHKEWAGKIEMVPRVPTKTREDLAIAYTPGVAEPCLAIKDNPDLSFELTRRWNTVAVITDGTAVLGLGDIGPEASMPVMEGKCVLFKAFANVDAIPLCIASKDVDEIVKTIELISSSFGGINLEDVAAPRCFEIEAKLKEKLNIPIFHDDQHGTAIVVLAGLINALKFVKKEKESAAVVISGAGSAGIAITKLLLIANFKNIVLCDKDGAITSDIQYSNPAHNDIAKITNPNKKSGMLTDILKGADVFIGVSAPNILTKDDIATMNKDSIVFAMANPVPEIFPDVAKEGGARIVASGRSDYPNQINNLLAFPGVFRGALDVRATCITDEMKLAAVYALVDIIKPEELKEDYIIPSPLDEKVSKKVAEAVAKKAVETGITKKK